MKKVLILGAGLVARPLVRYLLDQPGFQVTVAEQTVSKAEALVAGHPDGTTEALLVDQTAKLDRLIGEHDLVSSMLPAPLHPAVAKTCIKRRRHLVTPSYASPEMNALDGAARQAGVMILNEIGVDPGIDHMSAMRVIHDVQKRGGQVVSFRSYCGGLPAPEANDNPWGYKLSWSPRAVCAACKSSAHFRENGKQVDIPEPELFTCSHPVQVDGVGELEAYPNRDSLGYLDRYGLQGIETMFRGTFRYAGWCACLKKVVDLGLLDETPVTYRAGTTFAQFTAKLINASSTDRLRQQVAKHIGLDESSDVLHRLEWLGLFSDDELPITGRETTRLDVLAARMDEKMAYKKGERDMIVLLHQFVARFPDGQEERISSTLIDFGQPDGDSSMARTVSLPAAVSARLILAGAITDTGVHIPVEPTVYNPVLDELETLDIRCEEKTLPGA